MSRQTDDATDELDYETRTFMYDRMTDGLRVASVDECVRGLVKEMRKDHSREYDVPTHVLVDAAYDAAAEAIQGLKESNGSDIVAEVQD